MSSEISVSYQNFNSFKQNQAIASHVEKELTEASTTAEKLAVYTQYGDAMPTSEVTSFSIMSSEDAADENSYLEAIKLFTQDEISSKDTNNDGKLNIVEFREAKLKEAIELNEKLGIETTDEEKAEILASAHLLFNIIDISKNELIDLSELELFYQEMDKFKSLTTTTNSDGVLTEEQINGYESALLNKFYSQETKEYLQGLYLEQLEADSQG